MRTNRFRTTALAATALVAALSLTACGGEDEAMGTKPAGSAAETAAPAATSTDDGTSTDATKQPESPEAGKPETQTVPAGGKHAGGNGNGTGTGTGTNQSKKPEAAPNAGSSTAIPTCTPKNSRVKVSSVSRPINHLLLTVTNTGSTNCAAYYAPFLRFDDAQAVYPILEDSKPQAVVTLSPGEEAYAGIALLGEPGEDAPVKSANLGVITVDRNNQPKGEFTVKLPAGTVTDSRGFVTYWQSDIENALMF